MRERESEREREREGCCPLGMESRESVNPHLAFEGPIVKT